MHFFNQENNPNHLNLARRKKKNNIQLEPRPSTSFLEVTFQPLPKLKDIRSHQTIDHQDTALRQLQQLLPRHGKLRPVIAKSHKLQSFFGLESDRYHQKRKLSIQHEEHPRGRSLESDRLLNQKANVIAYHPTKKEFARLYKKQKVEYQKILKKHGILESINDEEYSKFMVQ